MAQAVASVEAVATVEEAVESSACQLVRRLASPGWSEDPRAKRPKLNNPRGLPQGPVVDRRWQQQAVATI